MNISQYKNISAIIVRTKPGIEDDMIGTSIYVMNNNENIGTVVEYNKMTGNMVVELNMLLSENDLTRMDVRPISFIRVN